MHDAESLWKHERRKRIEAETLNKKLQAELDHYHARYERIEAALLAELAETKRELTLAMNRLGNAEGAIIDSGTHHCDGPGDVAAAIYRLIAERDNLILDLVKYQPDLRSS